MLQKFGDTSFGTKTVERNVSFRDVSPERLDPLKDLQIEEFSLSMPEKVELDEEYLMDSAKGEDQEQSMIQIEKESPEQTENVETMDILTNKQFTIPTINVEYEGKINELPQTPVNSPEVTPQSFETVIIGES